MDLSSTDTFSNIVHYIQVYATVHSVFLPFLLFALQRAAITHRHAANVHSSQSLVLVWAS